jgi:hypothetical protein
MSLDLRAIKDRADVYGSARRELGAYNCGVTGSESADDVPALVAEVERLRVALDEIRGLHTESPAAFCPSCGRLGDVSDTDDGLVAFPCPTIRVIQEDTR